MLDISLPEATGLELQSTLGQRGHPWPVIFMTGFGTIPMSVQAMKAGAVEFLTKPFNDDQVAGHPAHHPSACSDGVRAMATHSERPSKSRPVDTP
ncbi:response regulator transcription factor [Pseudomonas frederiksbergensis]|uniref:response regulator transcription factor n=1 Tax=Pseudomonas TaxID=286 RepID=UPI002182034D|nr:response regulator [Pseudomonas frederiksbergensis]